MLEEKVVKTIKEYQLIKEEDTIVIGVSGGPDSMALLNILLTQKEIPNIHIAVAHINHKIREEAEEETKYVEEFCKKHEIPCFIKRIKIEEKAKEEKIGTEEAGRKARYEFFEEVANKIQANKIATAHHAGDNAETVLMNILRGTGISGLTGIDVIRENKLIRPLIKCTREEIEEYCKEEKLEPKLDKTNEENTYTRNKIRNQLIPYLQQEFNPNIIETINRLAEVAIEENKFLQNLTEKAYKEVLEEEYLGNKTLEEKNTIILSLTVFNQQEEIIKSKIVLYTIHKLLGNTYNIGKIHIEDIVNLCKNKIGNKYLTPNKNVKILVKNRKIFFSKQNNTQKG